MNNLYSVPKLEVEAKIAFPDSSKSVMTLFLSEHARAHSGYERLSDLLNGQDAFLPAKTIEDEFVVLNVESLLYVEVDAHFEFGDDTLDEAASELDQVLRLDIDVHLSDGSSLQGTIAYVLPPAQRRLQDVLNFDERFLIVRDHDRVCFINRRHIVKASPKA